MGVSPSVSEALAWPLATSTSSSSNRPPAVLWRLPPEPRLLRLPPPCLGSTAASTSTCALTATMLTDQTAKLPWTGCTWQSRTLPQPLQPLDVALLSSPRKTSLFILDFKD